MLERGPSHHSSRGGSTRRVVVDHSRVAGYITVIAGIGNGLLVRVVNPPGVGVSGGRIARDREERLWCRSGGSSLASVAPFWLSVANRKHLRSLALRRLSTVVDRLTRPLVRKGLGDSHTDEALDERLWQRRVDWELKRPGRRLVGGHFVPQCWKHGTTVGQVAEMVLERCESGDDLPLHPEGRDSIGDPLFSFRDDLKDRLAQALQSGPFRFCDVCQIVVNLGAGHGSDSWPTIDPGQEGYGRACSVSPIP